MAVGRLNEILTGRFNRALVRQFQIHHTPAPTLTPEITPVHILSSDDPLHALLKEERMQMAGGSQAAVAAQNSRISLVNPAGSGIIAYTEFVTFSTGTPQIIGVDTSSILDSIANNGHARDTRYGLAQGGALQVNAGTAATSITGMQFAVGASQPQSIPLQVALGPGTSLIIICNTVNTNLFAGFAWRERAAGPQELTAN